MQNSTVGLKMETLMIQTCSLLKIAHKEVVRRPLTPCKSPVVLHVAGLVSDCCKVLSGLADVGHGSELSDDIVSHLLHEANSLGVVLPRRKDLIQPCEVLL